MLKAPRARAVLQRWERRRLLFWKLIALAGLSLSGWLLFHPPAQGASGAGVGKIRAEPSARLVGRHGQRSAGPEPVDFQVRLAALRSASSQSARCAALRELGVDDANEVVVAAIDAYAAAPALVRGCALHALSQIPHPAASDCLAALLDEPDMSVRLSAVRALRIARSPTIPACRRRTRWPRSVVRSPRSTLH
jgi:hypothetical protein